MRTQAEWNVETHIIRARPPTSSVTRSRICAAALLVNVIARIEPGCAPCSAMSHAMRRVSTLVLPEPAPATTRSGPPRWATAARCASLRPVSSASADSRDATARPVRAAPDGVGLRGTGNGKVMSWTAYVRLVTPPHAGAGQNRRMHPFRIDPDGTEPPFDQIRRHIALAAASGSLAAGHKLPTVRQLAAELG